MNLISKCKSGGDKNGIGIGNAIGGGNGTKSGKRIAGVATIRDALACQWVCECGVMNSDQLSRAVWSKTESGAPSISPRYAYERVQRHSFVPDVLHGLERRIL